MLLCVQSRCWHQASISGKHTNLCLISLSILIIINFHHLWDIFYFPLLFEFNAHHFLKCHLYHCVNDFQWIVNLPLWWAHFNVSSIIYYILLCHVIFDRLLTLLYCMKVFIRNKHVKLLYVYLLHEQSGRNFIIVYN